MSVSRTVLPQSIGYPLQELVAGGVPEGIVDSLEIIKIDAENRKAVAAFHKRKSLLDALPEMQAIG